MLAGECKLSNRCNAGSCWVHYFLAKVDSPDAASSSCWYAASQSYFITAIAGVAVEKLYPHSEHRQNKPKKPGVMGKYILCPTVARHPGLGR